MTRGTGSGYTVRTHISARTAKSLMYIATHLKGEAERLYGEDWTEEADAVDTLAEHLYTLGLGLLRKLSPTAYRQFIEAEGDEGDEGDEGAP